LFVTNKIELDDTHTYLGQSSATTDPDHVNLVIFDDNGNWLGNKVFGTSRTFVPDEGASYGYLSIDTGSNTV